MIIMFSTILYNFIYTSFCVFVGMIILIVVVITEEKYQAPFFKLGVSFELLAVALSVCYKYNVKFLWGLSLSLSLCLCLSTK